MILTEIDTGIECRLQWLADDLRAEERRMGKPVPYSDLDVYMKAAWTRTRKDIPDRNREFMSTADLADMCTETEYIKNPLSYPEPSKEARKELRKAISAMDKAAEYLRRLEKWKQGDISDDGFVNTRYDKLTI